jgi:hypothetical protein
VCPVALSRSARASKLDEPQASLHRKSRPRTYPIPHHLRMKKQTTIKNFFSKRSSPDAAQDDATPKRPKLGSQSPVATE